MQWIAPSEKDQANNTLEKRLWDAADQFRANSGLTAAQYSAPVLGMIFLRFAETRFEQRRAVLEAAGASSRRSGSRVDDPAAYHAESVMYLPETARFAHLLAMPEGGNIGQAINDAMAEVEKFNPQLAGVLPRSYQLFASTLLKDILKKISEIPVSLEYDAFGRIYEYFLGAFARTEGQKGGEFYTPSSIVRLLVEVIEPFHGKVLDPACGSGGMFVQSARFVSEHRNSHPSTKLRTLPSGPSPTGRGGGEGTKFTGDPASELSIHGVEKTDETGRLARMNLSIHGLEGDIRHGGHINSYYDDPHSAVGQFDFVLANPPFNVNAVDKERLESDVGAGRRYPFGLPRTDNGNYLWIQLFYSSLNNKGRAGFVMANSASDARASEMELRKQLIEAKGVDVMVAVGPNMFYTVTLPCTLWFMDKAKAKLPPRPPSPPSPLPLGEGWPTGRGEGAKHGRGGFVFQGLVDEARALRQKQTPAEDALWELLRNRKLADLKFRRQHQIGDYIVDFFCPEHGLIVELDGAVHLQPDRQQHDAKRDNYLRALGHTVLRIENRHVFDKTVATLQSILDSLPSTTGRGAGGEGKQHGARYCDTVLFIDARHIYRQIDRAHRDWTEEQISFIANIVRLYRGESPDFTLGGTEAEEKLKEVFATSHESQVTIHYQDILGLCKAATLAEIEAQGWSLNPGRYVGVAPGEEISDEDFKEKLEALNEELEVLNAEARELESTIATNVAELLEA